MTSRFIGCVLFVVLCTIGFPLSIRAAQQSQGTQNLTVEDVVKMVQVKLADDLVIAQLRRNGQAFILSADDMVRLKTTGASDAVIRVMLNPREASGPVPSVIGGSRAADSSNAMASPEEAEIRLSALVATQSEGRVKVGSFRKTDGQPSEVNRVPVYRMAFDATIEFTQDCKWLREPYSGLEFKTRAAPKTTNGRDFNWDDFFEASQFPGTVVKAGQTARISGTLTFVKSERGWNLSTPIDGKVVSPPSGVGKPAVSVAPASSISPAVLTDPAEALIQLATGGDQDTNLFPVQSRMITVALEVLWQKTLDVLAKNKDDVATTDKQKGLIVTSRTKHGSFPVARYDRYAIALQRVDETTTKVTLKALLYVPVIGKGGQLNARPRDRVLQQGERLLDQLQK